MRNYILTAAVLLLTLLGAARYALPHRPVTSQAQPTTASAPDVANRASTHAAAFLNAWQSHPAQAQSFHSVKEAARLGGTFRSTIPYLLAHPEQGGVHLAQLLPAFCLGNQLPLPPLGNTATQHEIVLYQDSLLRLRRFCDVDRTGWAAYQAEIKRVANLQRDPTINRLDTPPQTQVARLLSVTDPGWSYGPYHGLITLRFLAQSEGIPDGYYFNGQTYTDDESIPVFEDAEALASCQSNDGCQLADNLDLTNQCLGGHCYDSVDAMIDATQPTRAQAIRALAAQISQALRDHDTSPFLPKQP